MITSSAADRILEREQLEALKATVGEGVKDLYSELNVKKLSGVEQRTLKRMLHVATVLDQVLRGWQ